MERSPLSATSTGAAITRSALRRFLETFPEVSNAHGGHALESNISGDENEAFGDHALDMVTTGSRNVAMGDDAGHNITIGSANTLIGFQAGISITGSGNVCIGAGVQGEESASDTTWIRNVNTLAQPIVSGIDGVTVRLSDGRLGHGISSRHQSRRQSAGQAC